MRLLAEKVRRNGGTVTYDGIALRFPPNVGVDFLSSIHWNGTDGYEPDVWRVLRQLIFGSQTFIDVGAHIGFYGVLSRLINPKLSIFAFEPVPELFSEARQFYNANGFATEGLNRLALSNEDGEGALIPSDRLPDDGIACWPAIRSAIPKNPDNPSTLGHFSRKETDHRTRNNQDRRREP